MNKTIIKMKYYILTALMLISTNALAQSTTLEDVANGLIPQLGNGVGPLLGALSYIFGIAMGVKGAIKLKEHNESKGQQVKLQTPIMFLLASAMFLALPAFINIGISTLGFDKGGEQTFKF
jgi:Ca2+/Na+ antiporter